MSPDFLHRGLVRGSELLDFTSLSKLHSLTACPCDWALNASHSTEWLHAVRPGCCKRFFLWFLLPATLCWAGHKSSSWQQRTLSSVSYISLPTSHPLKEGNEPGQRSETEHRVVRDEETSEIGIGPEKAGKCRAPRGARKWAGRRPGWDGAGKG